MTWRMVSTEYRVSFPNPTPTPRAWDILHSLGEYAPHQHEPDTGFYRPQPVLHVVAACVI